MNPLQLDQLRDALQREAEEFQPVGVGPETVQRRGRRRRSRTRGRSLIAGVAAVGLAAGVGVSVVPHGSRDGGTDLAIGTRGSGEPAPALDFRRVEGTVDFGTHFTAADGVTYELSTAPGAAGDPERPGQAIYTTRDGEHWTTAEQSKSWISDLAEGDGVLYAVGTAPGATANDVRYRLATSSDGGHDWTDANLPFDASTPDATVSLSRSSSVQVARGAASTVALLTEQFWPDLDALVATHAPGHANASTRQTDAGFAIVDMSECAAARGQLAASGTSPNTLAADAAKNADAAKKKCVDPPVVGTITWAEVGLSSAGDLIRQQLLVSTDGTHWNSAAAPDGAFARELVATDDGFLMLLDDVTSAGSANKATVATKVLRSTDARQWTDVSTPAGLNVQAIAGGRIVGLDAAGSLQTSTDGGATWNATAIGAQLPAGSPAATAANIDAGPLGFAVLAVADADPNDQHPGHDYLLFSTDGISWTTSDLAAIGEPNGGYPTSVIVGSDHLGVTYQSPGATTGSLTKLTTLLATPER